MSKYLIIANYATEGVKGILAKGGTARKTAVVASIEGLGGSVESFYFGFGDGDAYVLVDLPNNVSAAALAMQVSASGMASARTVVLLTPDEIDQAAKIPNSYRAPGS